MLRQKFAAIALATLAVGSLVHTASAQDSDRNQVRARISAGGWYVVYGELVNEAEYAKMAAALYAGSPQAYFNDYLNRTIVRVQRTAPEVARRALYDTVRRALRDRGRTFRLGKVGVKGGIATYRRWKYVSSHVPTGQTERYKIKGPFGTWTWGYRPEMKLVRKRIPLPNHHQPYVAFRIYSTGSTPSPSPGGNLQQIRYTLRNASGQTVRFRLPSGRSYVLYPGQTQSYRNTGRPGAMQIYVYNSRRTYTLRSGNHIFWKMSSGRIGLDLRS